MAETPNNNNIFHFLKYPSPINSNNHNNTHTCPHHHHTLPPSQNNNNITPVSSENSFPPPPKKQKTTLYNPDGTPKVFQCQFCPRTFGSYKALGGHQNAHKRERAAARADAPPPPPVFQIAYVDEHGNHNNSDMNEHYYCCGFVNTGCNMNNGGYFGSFNDTTMVHYSAPPLTVVSDGGFDGGYGRGVFSMGPGPNHEQVMMNNNKEDTNGVNLELTLGTF